MPGVGDDRGVDRLELMRQYLYVKQKIGRNVRSLPMVARDALFADMLKQGLERELLWSEGHELLWADLDRISLLLARYDVPVDLYMEFSVRDLHDLSTYKVQAFLPELERFLRYYDLAASFSVVERFEDHFKVPLSLESLQQFDFELFCELFGIFPEIKFFIY